MKIGGLLKFSLIDYPDKMSAVIFTQGCNFRCSYCHNPELVAPRKFQGLIPEGEVLAFLEKRRGQLEGVVVTGGEPTIQKDLLFFLHKIKGMDYCVKLDTNGSNPQILREVIDYGLVDYIAMDIKAPLEKYHLLTPIKDCAEQIRKSIHIIISSNVVHEFRTTMAASVNPPEDLPKMVSLIEGTKKYRLQKFIARENSILDERLLKEQDKDLSDQEILDLQNLWGIENKK